MSNDDHVTTAAGDTTAEPKEFGKKFLGTLKKLIEDVTTLEVATYVTYGEQTGDITVKVDEKDYKAELQAYTKISLDADTIALLPAKKQDQEIIVREELYDIHKEHVAMAKETREAMLKTMLDAIGSVLDVFGT
jgi:hypothetical protein